MTVHDRNLTRRPGSRARQPSRDLPTPDDGRASLRGARKVEWPARDRCLAGKLTTSLPIGQATFNAKALCLLFEARKILDGESDLQAAEWRRRLGPRLFAALMAAAEGWTFGRIGGRSGDRRAQAIGIDRVERALEILMIDSGGTRKAPGA
jgi:hypothetical protein